MAFQNYCSICSKIIEKTDLFINFDENTDNNFTKLISHDLDKAHLSCVRKFIQDRGDDGQLKLFK